MKKWHAGQPKVTTCLKFMWIYGWEPLVESHHFAMLGDHWSSAKDTSDLTKPRYWRIMQLYLAPYRMSPICQFGSHKHCGNGDIMVSIYHVILQDNVAKGLCNFTCGSCSRYVAIPPTLVIIGTVLLEI